jgi:hypothetical protein
MFRRLARVSNVADSIIIGGISSNPLGDATITPVSQNIIDKNQIVSDAGSVNKKAALSGFLFFIFLFSFRAQLQATLTQNN